jgi:site-specific DNA-methyltransferase (adenine-specific)
MGRVEHIGDAVLMLGDCRELLPTLGKVDAVVTDPPYGIGFPYHSYCDTRENLRALIKALFHRRALYNRLVILCGPTQIHEYPATDWVGAITWNTTGSFGKFGYSQWTPVLLYGDDLAGFGNVNGVTKTDTYQINGGAAVGFQRTEEEAAHTCPKPLNIMQQTVQRYTAQHETILDPFMGSGTTGVACAKLGRKFIGIEIEPKYFDIACRRIEQAYKQPDFFIEKPAPAKQEALI